MKSNDLKRKEIEEHRDKIRAKTQGKNINLAKEIMMWRRKISFSAYE